MCIARECSADDLPFRCVACSCAQVQNLEHGTGNLGARSRQVAAGRTRMTVSFYNDSTFTTTNHNYNYNGWSLKRTVVGNLVKAVS